MSERIPVRKDLFIEDLDGWRLIGNKCTSCGQSYFPKVATSCLNCGKENLEDKKFSSHGTLYSYAPSNVPTQHFKPPFVIGYITLEDNVRVASQLVEAKGKPFKIGMQMEMLMDTLWTEGNVEVFGYKFKPI